MDLDIDQEYGQIFSSDAEFQKAMLDLQEFRISKEKGRKWANRLRFLAPPYSPCLPDEPRTVALTETPCTVTDHKEIAIECSVQSGSASTVSIASSRDDCSCSSSPAFTIGLYKDSEASRLLLTSPGQFEGCSHYVAVSYCWKRRGEAPHDEHLHRVLTGDGGDRPCKAPADVLERAMLYASSRSAPFVWIDQECIDQNNRDDQEDGIQAMDLVYQRSFYPVGILDASFDAQEELDVIEKLYSGEDLGRDEMGILKVIMSKFAKDKWFSRAWILQESTSAGGSMDLMARHDARLTKAEWFGEIAGELVFSIHHFHTMLSWSFECLRQYESELQPDLHASIDLDTNALFDALPISVERLSVFERNPAARELRCTAAQALFYLKKRKNSRIADRITIMGNLCDYEIRLDTRSNSRWHFTAYATALALFNGDLSLCNIDQGRCDSRLTFSWGPLRRISLATLDHSDDEATVLLGPTEITRHGLKIGGSMWRTDLIRVQSARDFHQQGLDLLANDGPAEDPSALFANVCWHLILELLRNGHSQLADLAWKITNAAYVAHAESEIQHDLMDIVDPETGNILDTAPDRVRSDDFLSALFDQDESLWTNKRWLPEMVMDEGRIVYGHLADEFSTKLFPKKSWAIFGKVKPGSLVLTASAASTHRILGRNEGPHPLAWSIEGISQSDDDAGSDEVVVNGRPLDRGAWSSTLALPTKSYVLA